MAVTDSVKIGLEGTLSYCLEGTADETDTDAVWVELGYVEDFNIDDNPNDFEYYNKYTRQTPKRGRPEISGSIGQLYTNYPDSVLKLAVDRSVVAFKLAIADNGQGAATEVLYIKNASFGQKSFKGGNLNESNPVSVSVNYKAEAYHFHAPTA